MMENELVILLEKFLCKQANAEEIVRLKELFNQAESQEIVSALYEEKWAQATFSPDTEVEERIWNQLQEQIGFDTIPKQLPLWKKGLRIAASILIPLFCVYLGYYYSENKSEQLQNQTIVQVDVGQKANMQLPDGTQVWLNSASSLVYDPAYNKKDRVVYLQGEAYFEVNKDKQRPFIVKTDDVSIEALGTSFNVKAYPDDNYVTTTLIEGSVRISSPFQSDMLLPNEKLTFSKNNRRFTKNELLDAERNTSWINNQLAFEQERLEEIAKVLERMYSVQVHFASENLKDIRFSGTIKNHNLESVLQLIAFVSPIYYSIENNSTILIHANSHKGGDKQNK
jgi:ferric-dicitrate binding protein FerR (iron transport regulator)